MESGFQVLKTIWHMPLNLQSPIHTLDESVSDRLPSRRMPCECQQWSERIQHRWRLLNPDQQPFIAKQTRFTSQQEILNTTSTRLAHLRREQRWRTVHHSIHHAYQTPQHNLDPLIKQLNRWRTLGFTIAFVAWTHNRIERLNAMLRSHGTTYYG